MTHEEYYAPPSKNKQLSPREIVGRDRATKYSDATIKEYIEYARTNSPEYIPASAQIAQAMIAYNRMIDERTWAAERSWREK